mmetsp:Transcript_6428/g.6337  ORF Transcript_6428/g.6337 Transcript_6428/m.6337 type:complete len:189 (-) Transcript_6428:147-713(-)
MTSVSSNNKYRRRSSGGTLSLVVAASAVAAATMTGDTSAFTQYVPRRSSMSLPASFAGGDNTGGSAAVLDRPFNLVDNLSVKKKLNKIIDSDRQEKNMDDDEWELRLYDDNINTREKVARALVQVTGSSESDAFKTLMSAQKNGFACVGNKLCFETAEMYNEGLRQQCLLSEIFPVTRDTAGSDSEWE